MKPKTEEFLNLLMWTAERLVVPSFRNLTSSYESWAYRNGLHRQLDTLERGQWVERDLDAGDRVYRLTERGRLHALGGRDPEACWSRAWDGQWRIIMFDIPIRRNAARAKLRRYLVERGFGFVQRSAWITPDPLQTEAEILEEGKVDVASLLLLEARPCAGESDAEIVDTSWNFAAINERYEKHLSILASLPKIKPTGFKAAEEIKQWAKQEREAWLHAVKGDPLLPRVLLPADYLGCKAWKKRVQILARAARLIRRFQPLD